MTEKNNFLPSSFPAGTLCIDVSSYQGAIDWNAVKQSGISCAILRGVTKNGQLDTSFTANLNQAENAGVKIIGVYHFSYALNEETAANDAANMISKLNGKKMDIYLDLEWNQQRALGRAKVTSIAKAYVNICKIHDYTCHIYSNLDWYKNVYYPAELSALGCRFWIARYPSNDTGIPKENLKPNVGESIWQYSSKGNIPGIRGNVDCSRLCADLTVPTPPSPIVKRDTGFLGQISTRSDALSIRQLPDIHSEKVGSYPKDELIPIIAETSNGWYETLKGYIAKGYVREVN